MGRSEAGSGRQRFMLMDHADTIDQVIDINSIGIKQSGFEMKKDPAFLECSGAGRS
jgi:hypothetical protein